MVRFFDVELAFEFVSSAEYGTNSAFLNKKTSEVLMHSRLEKFDEFEEGELDPAEWIAIPHKNELDLGRQLLFEFVEEHLPDDYDLVREFFQRRGAYARFKDLLESKGMLQRWYDFEHQRQDEALRQWCADSGIEVSD